MTRTSLNVAIVDDEPLARESLRIRLGWIPDVRVIAEASSGDAAIAQLDDRAVDALDVIFLDVEMSDVDGFTVLHRLERGMLPVIVFVTAHDHYALDAFRVGAFDYLLKPFDDETLRDTVERARVFVSLVRRDAGTSSSERTHDVPAASLEPSSDGAERRLCIRTQGRVVFLDLDEVDWVEAMGDYVRVHAGAASYTMRATMRSIGMRLVAPRFLRVHRGAIVAARMIRGLQPYSRGEHLVVLKTGVKLPLSRRYRTRVEMALATG